MSLSISILKLPNFRLLILTRILTTFALQAQAVIVGWQIYSITKDPFLLGLTGLVEAVPALTCALFAGHIVDKSSPYKIFWLCVGFLTLNTFFLLLVGGGTIPMDTDHLLIAIFVGVFFSGLARSFYMPASFALLPVIVLRKEIPAAASWLTSGFQTAAIAGPAIAGLIYGGYGPHGAWFMPFIILSMALLTISLMKAPSIIREESKKELAVKSIKAGWAFIIKNPTILSVMTLDMFAVLFGGAVAMLPAIAEQILHVGPEGLGALRAAPALGAVFTALVFALRPMKIYSAKRLLFVVAGFGVCMIGFGLSTSFWLSMLFLALSGAFDSVSMITRGTIMQLLTPDHMRGRVSSVNSMFIISSNEIGAFESGLAAKWLGLTPSIVFGGIATLFVVAATASLSPSFRKMVIKTDEA